MAELWELGTAGVVEQDGQLEAYFADGVDLAPLIRQFGPAVLSIGTAPDVAQAENDFEPFPLGSRFLVVDSADTPGPGRIRLHLQTGEAFGSGRHETTQLMVEALERLELQGAIVFDIGCGSGILSAAALLLGAKAVVACDTHERSVIAARSQFAEPDYFVGSADALASSSADVVMANITPKILDHLAGELNRILKPDGKLLLSGFLSDTVPAAFVPESVASKNDWQCWHCSRESYRSAAVDATAALQPFDQRWW